MRLKETIASGMEEDEEAGPVRRWTAATCSDPTACWSTDSTHQVVPVAPVVVALVLEVAALVHRRPSPSSQLESELR